MDFRLVIWLFILFLLGLFLLGIGIWIFANPKLRTEKDQRKAGHILIVVGFVLIVPFLYVKACTPI